MTEPGWASLLPAGRFQRSRSLPSCTISLAGNRGSDLLAALRLLLDAEGVIVVSVWQFINEARLERKVVPWSAIGLSEEQVESGDVLLDWRRGGSGLRYCHLVSESELAALAQAAGLVLTDVYYADGRSQKLNLFGVLRRASLESEAS